MYVFARGGFVEHNDGGRRRRRGGLVAAGAGLVLAVVLTSVSASSASSSADASASGHPGAASADAAAPVRLTGKVTQDGVHTGDLRDFPLPAPTGADDYGDPDGSVLTAADQAATRGALTSYGSPAGAYRTYLTADDIAVASADQAAGYDSALSYQGATIALGGDHPARGCHLACGSAERSEAELAVSYQGDVPITVTVTGGQDAAGTQSRDLLDAQYQRLATGR